MTGYLSALVVRARVAHRRRDALQLGLSDHALAMALDVSATRINEIARERRTLRAATARLAQGDMLARLPTHPTAGNRVRLMKLNRLLLAITAFDQPFHHGTAIL